MIFSVLWIYPYVPLLVDAPSAKAAVAKFLATSLDEEPVFTIASLSDKPGVLLSHSKQYVRYHFAERYRAKVAAEYGKAWIRVH